MMKKKIKIIILTLLIIIIIGLIMGIIIYFKKDDDSSRKEETNILKEIKEYGYKLEDSKTPLYKQLFEQLHELLSKEEINEEEYAILVSKLFIADFYDLNSKINNNDVGGIQFIHSEIKDNFILKATETLYKYVENILYGDRKQKLPSVAEVTLIDIETVTYKYNDKEDKEAYKLISSWEYKEDLGYQKECTMFLVHEGKKLSIVEIKEVEN